MRTPHQLKVPENKEFTSNQKQSCVNSQRQRRPPPPRQSRQDDMRAPNPKSTKTSVPIDLKTKQSCTKETTNNGRRRRRRRRQAKNDKNTRERKRERA